MKRMEGLDYCMPPDRRIAFGLGQTQGVTLPLCRLNDLNGLLTTQLGLRLRFGGIWAIQQDEVQ
jgi:hypothetical protein